jgi:hypothetical protein
MASREQLIEYGKNTRFSKTNQPKTRGRKKRQLKRFIKETNLSIEDQVLIFEEITCNYDINEIKKMISSGKDDKGEPLSGLLWGFLVAWIKDTQRGWSSGGINTALRERKYGKVPEKVHQVNEDVTSLTPAERKERIDKLYEIYRNQMSGSSDSTIEQSEGSPRGAEETVNKESGEAEEQDN